MISPFEFASHPKLVEAWPGYWGKGQVELLSCRPFCKLHVELRGGEFGGDAGGGMGDGGGGGGGMGDGGGGLFFLFFFFLF